MRLIFTAAILFFLSVLIGIAGNDTKKTKVAFPFNYGKMHDSTYVNPYFNFELKTPNNWVVQNKAQLEIYYDNAKNSIESNDEAINEKLSKINLKDYVLLTLSKYEIGTAVASNPTLLIMAEPIFSSPGIKKGSDYLFQLKNILKTLNIRYAIQDNPKEEVFSGKKFNSILADRLNNEDEILLHQEYYSTILNGYALSFLINFNEIADREELYNIIKQVEFK